MPDPEHHMENRVHRRWWLHLLLFFTTCATTFYAGLYSGGVLSFSDGIIYMSAIMTILLVHELGHFTAARIHKVDASLPYFIPMPLPPIGTFGAVITMARPPETKASLLDIGAAGPLAGVLVAIPVCFLGLVLSKVQPLSQLPKGAIMEGNSLLYMMLKHLAHPEMGPGDDVFLHPLAWAGWIGLLVTSLNMLPAGQLDGGHVVYALFGRKAHFRIAWIVRRGVLLLGLTGLACQVIIAYKPAFAWMASLGLDELVLRASGMLGWLIWAILLRFVGGKHPSTHDENTPLDPWRRMVGWTALGIMVLTFMPVFISPVSVG